MYESHALTKELASEKRKEERLARMTELEDQIYERAGGVAAAFISFHEVLPGQSVPPPSWVEEYGQEGAEQRLRVAVAGWLPANEAPSAVKTAVTLLVGISKARGFRGRAVQNQLNVKIQLPAPTSAAHPGPVVYPTKEIDV